MRGQAKLSTDRRLPRRGRRIAAGSLIVSALALGLVWSSVPVAANAADIPLTTQCVAGLTPMAQLSTEGANANGLVPSFTGDHVFVATDSTTTTLLENEYWTNSSSRTVRNARLFLGSVGAGSTLATTYPNGWIMYTFKTGNDHQSTYVAGDPSYRPGATGADPAFAGYYIRFGTPAQFADATPISWETFATDGIPLTWDTFAAGGSGDPTARNDADAIAPAIVYGDIAPGADTSVANWYVILDKNSNGTDVAFQFNSRLAGQYDCPVVASGPADTGTLSSAYSSSVAATIVEGTVSYQLAPGSSLPAGLSLDATTGQITGTPTASGATTFSIDAVDAYGEYDRKSYTITIDATAAPASTTTSAATPELAESGSDMAPALGASLVLLATGAAALVARTVRRRRRA